MLDFGSSLPIDPFISAGLNYTLNFDGDSLQSDQADFGTFPDPSAPITLGPVSAGVNLGIIATIVGDIQAVTEPIQPIINVLTANIPGLDSIGINVSLIDLLADFTGANADDINSFFQDITDINNLHLGPDSTKVSVTVLNSVVISDPRSGLMPQAIANSAVSNLDPEQALNGDEGDNQSFDSLDTSSNSTPPLFTFPFLSDPVADVIPLLLGDTSSPPQIFTFNLSLPTFGDTFSIPVGSIPPFVPVIDLDIGVNIGLQLSGGYDLTGLFDYLKDPSPSMLGQDFADGFYIDGNQPLLTFGGSIGLEADAYVADLKGTLSVQLGLNLNGDGTGPDDEIRFDTLSDLSLKRSLHRDRQDQLYTDRRCRPRARLCARDPV